jgi:2Fe-2S ferredoxin
MPKVTFANQEGLAVEVDAGTSLLEAAQKCGAHVGESCGGNCACSTCHVWVTDGADSLSEMEEAEDDRLDMGFDVREESRLACQAKLGDEDVVVEITEESLQAWLDEHPEERKKVGSG